MIKKKRSHAFQREQYVIGEGFRVRKGREM